MEKTAVVFHSDQVKEMAEYIYMLTKLGAAYRVENLMDGWAIIVTGF